MSLHARDRATSSPRPIRCCITGRPSLIRTSVTPPLTASKPSYTKIFGDWLCDMAALDSRLIGITPAMREGSGLVRFEREYPTDISMSASPSSMR